MKLKTIEIRMSKIVNEFFENFFKYHFSKLYSQYEDHYDEYLEFLFNLKKSMFIAGDSITNMILNKKVKDFSIFIENEDIRMFIIDYCFSFTSKYCKDFDQTLKWTNKFNCFYSNKEMIQYEDVKFIDEFDSLNDANYFYNISFYHEFEINYFNGFNKSSKIIFSKNAITIDFNDNVFQFIICNSFNRKHLKHNFDFVHTLNYYNIDLETIVLNNEAMMSIINKSLIYLQSSFPIVSLIRTKKFEKFNWKIDDIELFKICNDISKLSLNKKIDYINAFCGLSNIKYIEVIKILDEYNFDDEINFNDFIKKVEILILNK